MWIPAFFCSSALSRLFNQTELNLIRSRRFSSIIVGNTKILPREHIQADVFRLRPSDPCASFSFANQISELLLDPCTPWETFDYFEGSSGAYKATFVVVGLYTLFLFGIVLLGVLYKQGRLTLSSRSKANLNDSTYGLAGLGVVRIFAEELKVKYQQYYSYRSSE